MSRREFNKSILPMTAPLKSRRYPKRKPNNRRCENLKKFLLGLKKTAGNAYNIKEFAKTCVVKESTVKLWFSGKPYGALSGESIARYFSPLVRIRLSVLRRQVEEIRLQAWKDKSI